MLSNAIDFRVRTKKLISQHQARKSEGSSSEDKGSGRLRALDFGRNRPKSADFERVSTISENPGGASEQSQVPMSGSSVDFGHSLGETLNVPNGCNHLNLRNLQTTQKPLHYSSAASLSTLQTGGTDNGSEITCGHRQISTEQINMLVTPDTFPIITSPTSPRTSKDNNISNTSLASRILNGANFSPFSLTTSRHSLPNLDPDDMEVSLEVHFRIQNDR